MTTTDQHSATPAAGRGMRWVIWLPGLAVAVGAAVATAHGLYEVAHAARVPTLIAWLYPLITDGLALVAYAATARLIGSGARYAWAVVVLAAGLSGLAQAVFLASDSTVEVSAVLRFGVGAWPAIAAAIVAHLLYLLAADHPAPTTSAVHGAVQSGVVPVPDRPGGVAVQSVAGRAVQPTEPGPVHRPALNAPDAAEDGAGADRSALPAAAEPRGRRLGAGSAGERARAAAARHAHRHDQLPTVTELAADAQVSRGTAHTVLKTLRAQPEPLHLVTTPTPGTGRHDRDEDDPTIEDTAQR